MADNTIEVLIRAKTKGFDKVMGKIGKLGQKMSDIGKTLTIGVTLPLVAAGAAAVKLASDFDESLSKVNVVFGQSAEAIEDWSRDAATAMGMSSQEALEAAGTYGNLLKAIGSTDEEASDMSMTLVQLAGDLASFNNLNTEEVLVKLRAGLTGEAEALKSLGVNMNAARLEAKALELGLISQGQALDANSKMQAAYAIIMEDTELAQGDFARTSDGLANSLKIMQSLLKDLGAELGEVLLPTVTEGVQKLSGMIGAFKELPDPVQNAIVKIGIFLAALGPISTITGKTLVAVKGLGAALGGKGALAVGFASLKGVISATVMPALTALGAAIAAVTAPVWLLIAAVGALIFTVWALGDEAWASLKRISGMIAEIVKVGLPMLIEKAKELGSSVLSGLQEGIAGSWDKFRDWLTDIALKIIDTLKRALKISSPSGLAADEIGGPLADGIAKGFQDQMAHTEKMLQHEFGSAAAGLECMAKNEGMSIGAGIGEGISVGFTSAVSGSITGKGGIAAHLAKTTEQMFRQIRSMLGISSPSKMAAAMIGAPIAQGVQVGYANQMLGGTGAMASQALNGLVPAGAAAGGGGLRMGIQKIEYHGSFSDEERKQLRKDSERAAVTTATTMLERMRGN